MTENRKQEYDDFNKNLNKFNITDEVIAEGILYLSKQFLNSHYKQNYTMNTVSMVICNYFVNIAPKGVSRVTLKDFYDDDTGEIDLFFIDWIIQNYKK